jgi:16S rRNA processing protein RimM
MIAIGQITKSVGIKGELKVYPMTNLLQRFKLLRKVWLGLDDQGGSEYAVEAVRLGNDHVVLKLAGINQRTDSDSLKQYYVLIPDEQAVRGTEGSYFVHELIGMNVVTEEGVQVGTISEILHMPAGDIWEIRSGDKEILIPGVREFIRKVDVEGRKVVIHVIEGLLE